MGIFAKEPQEQRGQARIYMAAKRPTMTNHPLSPAHERVLALLVEGKDKREIADALNERLPYIKFLVKEIAIRFGVTARGRGIQEKLICTVAKHRKSPEITMDDPEF